MDDTPRSLADERRRLLAELDLERNQLWRNIEWCRIRDIERPFVGDWSLKDIIGHIATWEAEVVTAFRSIAAGRRPELYDFEAQRLDDWNIDHVERKRDIPFWAMVEQLRGGRERLLSEIAEVSDEELLREGSRRERLVRSVIEHDRHHWHDIAAKVAGMQGARSTGHDSVVDEAVPAT
ncbi:MAG: DinB family protein [Dehalococcoidia bacterium]|nr:DinB family protein [Dehalococcoidia bacterium]